MIILRKLFSFVSKTGKEVFNKIMEHKSKDTNARLLQKIANETKNYCDWTIPISNYKVKSSCICIGSYYVHPDYAHKPQLSKYILVFLDPETDDLMKMEFSAYYKNPNKPNPLEIKKIIMDDLQEYKGVKREKYPMDEFKKDLVMAMQGKLGSLDVCSVRGVVDTNEDKAKVTNAINEEIDFIKRL